MDNFIKWIDNGLKHVSKEYLYTCYFSEIILNDSEEDVNYLSNYEKGIELVLSKLKLIETVHLFGAGNKDYKKFSGELPLKLSFSFSRQDIIKLFGPPQRSGGGHQNILIGFINKWDKYFFPNYSIRFEYSNNKEGLILVSLGSLTLENRFNIGLQ